MPIYEYECLSCAHRFDELQRFSDPQIETCPRCSSKVRKLLFPAAVIFKGSGFYATEYGKSKNNAGNKSGEPAAGETKTEKSEKSESKPAETKPAASCSTSKEKSSS